MAYHDYWSRPHNAAGKRSLKCNLSQGSCRLSGRAVNGAPREVRFAQVCGGTVGEPCFTPMSQTRLRSRHSFGSVQRRAPRFRMTPEWLVLFSCSSGGEIVAFVDELYWESRQRHRKYFTIPAVFSWTLRCRIFNGSWENFRSEQENRRISGELQGTSSDGGGGRG